MQTDKQSSLPLILCVVVTILLCKIYQHHRVVHLTHAHQQLCHQHAHLIKECMDLRAQQERVASLSNISAQAHKKDRMQPLNLAQVIPLRDGLTTRKSP